MEIKATDVKALREKTGAGMMDCKKALIDSNGDFTKAVKKLKELGLAAAAKRSGKAANEGRIFSKVGDTLAAVVELACETDFVSRNQDFVQTGAVLLDTVVGKKITEKNAELEGIVDDLKSRIKENIILKRVSTMPVAADEYVADYIHGEGKIGVLVKAKLSSPEMRRNEGVRQFVFDCALHIAAFSPLYLDRSSVDAAYLQEQEEIFAKQAAGLDKPANVVAGIVKGKLNKHLAEVVMVEQGFVRDEKRKVSEVMRDIGKQAGGTVELTDFRYFKVGDET